MPLPEEDEIAQWDEELRDRYTEADAAYVDNKRKTRNGPPIVEQWYPSRGRGGGRGGRGGGGWRNNERRLDGNRGRRGGDDWNHQRGSQRGSQHHNNNGAAADGETRAERRQRQQESFGRFSGGDRDRSRERWQRPQHGQTTASRQHSGSSPSAARHRDTGSRERVEPRRGADSSSAGARNEHAWEVEEI